MIRSGYIPSTEELLRSAEITPADIADAKKISDRRAPRMIPALHAILIPASEESGPTPDPSP